MKKRFLVTSIILLYLFIGFLLMVNENSFGSFTMFQGIIKGFFLPAKIIAWIFVRGVYFYELHSRFVPFSLGVLLGVIIFLSLIYSLKK